MSGTTVPLGFPYPTGTDLVINGDNAIQALADAVDDYFVGVDGLTLTAGTNINLGSSKAYRRGRLVVLSIEALAATGAIGTGATILTLPTGARPPDNIRGLWWNHTAGTVLLVQVFTTGIVQNAQTIASGNQIYGSMVIPLPVT